jgi:hypothetical protein
MERLVETVAAQRDELAQLHELESAVGIVAHNFTPPAAPEAAS